MQTTINEKILNYLSKNFNGFENCFLRYTVENLLIYAEHNFNDLESCLIFLEQILPEVTIDELRGIVND